MWQFSAFLKNLTASNSVAGVFVIPIITEYGLVKFICQVCYVQYALLIVHMAQVDLL